MRKLAGVVSVSAMLLLSCVGHAPVIPDPTVPHQVAEEASIKIWIEQKDGTKVKQDVRLLEGWWIAGPPVVDPMP